MRGVAGLRPLTDLIWTRLNRPFRIGITGRLMFSFVAVTVVAATANLIAEHGVAVIRTRHVDRGLVSPPPVIARAAAAPRATDSPAPVVRAAYDPNPLLAAIERYHGAVEVNATIDSAAALAESPSRHAAARRSRRESRPSAHA